MGKGVKVQFVREENTGREGEIEGREIIQDSSGVLKARAWWILRD